MPAFIDLTGQKFGKLKVINLSNKTDNYNRKFWTCLCDCGNITAISASNLKSGNSTSCGCYRDFQLTGLRFTRLLVKEKSQTTDNGGNTYWTCACDCGNVVDVRTSSLNSGNTRSCGCLERDTLVNRNKSMATHGMSRTPIYQAWNAMHQRCYNSNTENYQDYGGRGISVCERWNSFENFYSDMGDKPSPEYTIERRDVNGNYEPSNCYWATWETQANNRRNSVLYNYNGEVATASVFARKYGLNVAMLEYRLNNGWSINLAIETPSKRKQHA